ncbi:hypothetical protein [Pseudomonas mangiferae]|uniref:Uncharacterized protein n=1 Tax=Pseudomonas mangiferae TaxID=2593654 RepID=A0A553H0K6_9PSED|nr:hypothetical protein [Pseudomonas mangiferae]TRX75277.1 hypothetical protein FM069_09295 [Pseudomonas mangiferae]
MAALQDDGRIGECAQFLSLPIHFAWGRGNSAWDVTPEPEPTNATTLVDEVGRRTLTQGQFVTPDPTGEIELPGGQRYRPSATPTKWAHIRVTFDFEDAANETIREVAVFYGTVIAAGLPAGQRYFTPAQLIDRGRMKVLQRLPNKIKREAGTRQTFEYVLPF